MITYCLLNFSNISGTSDLFRKHCQKCRFDRCLAVGMKPGWVLSKVERQRRFRRRLNSNDDPGSMMMGGQMHPDMRRGGPAFPGGFGPPPPHCGFGGYNNRPMKYPNEDGEGNHQNGLAAAGLDVVVKREIMDEDEDEEEADERRVAAYSSAAMAAIDDGRFDGQFEQAQELLETLRRQDVDDDQGSKAFPRSAMRQQQNYQRGGEMQQPMPFQKAAFPPYPTPSSSRPPMQGSSDFQQQESRQQVGGGKVPRLNTPDITEDIEEDAAALARSSKVASASKVEGSESPPTDPEENASQISAQSGSAASHLVSKVYEVIPSTVGFPVGMTKAVVTHLSEMYDMRYKSVSFGANLLKEMMLSSLCGVPLSAEASVASYRLMVERVSKVAKGSDEFVSLPAGIQEELLRRNADAMVILQGSSFFQGETNGVEQVCR